MSCESCKMEEIKLFGIVHDTLKLENVIYAIKHGGAWRSIVGTGNLIFISLGID